MSNNIMSPRALSPCIRIYTKGFSFLLLVFFLACQDPYPPDPDPPDPDPPSDKSELQASMAWVSMREGLIELNPSFSGTDIGVVVTSTSAEPSYDAVKDLPGFYTRSAVSGSPRTVYLSLTDKMTPAKLNARVLTSVDYGADAATAAQARASNPELLHPNSTYYAHIYYGSSTKKHIMLQFKTSDFPGSFPSSRGTWSTVYAKIAAGPTIELKQDEYYAFPLRLYEADDDGMGYDSFQVNLFDGSTDYQYSVFTISGGRPLGRISASGEIILGALYDFYSTGGNEPRKNNLSLLDLLRIGKIRENGSFHWNLSSADGKKVYQDFDYTSKASLVSE